MRQYTLLAIVSSLACSSPEPIPSELIGVIVTGQSLSVGERGVPVVSIEPMGNLMLVDRAGDPEAVWYSDKLELAPLIAPMRPAPTDYTLPYTPPRNIIGEDPGIGYVNQLREVTGATYVVTNVGETAHGIDYIEKGGLGTSYRAALFEVENIYRLASEAGSSYRVESIFLVHGEADATLPNYAARVEQMRITYDTDIKAITGQSNDVVMVISPQCTQPSDFGASTSALAGWQLADRDPEHFVLAGPKYQVPYSEDDHLHLRAPEYRWLGEQAAHAFLTRRALRPLGARLEGDTIRVDFDVPVAPLEWDDGLGPPHPLSPEWAAGRGFEVLDDAGPITILSAAIQGSAVLVRLGDVPGAGLRVAYALRQDVQTIEGGTPLGRHGQLRDSDTFMGYSGRVHRNYAVQFELFIQ